MSVAKAELHEVVQLVVRRATVNLAPTIGVDIHQHCAFLSD